MSDRHAFRAKWHDYNAGIYFITICTHEKRHIFGHISNGEMCLSSLGKIADSCIREISSHHNDAEVWNHVVMPNHIHIMIAVGTRYIASEMTNGNKASEMTDGVNVGCLKPPNHGDAVDNNHFNSRLAVIVGTLKAAVTRQANKLYRQCGRDIQCGRDVSRPYWQSRYYEHIVTNGREFDKIMDYIDNNVTKWSDDCFNK